MLKGAIFDADGTLPQETAVFEGVLHGIQAAKKTGFITVAIEDLSNRSEREQFSGTADYFIRDFTDPLLRTI